MIAPWMLGVLCCHAIAVFDGRVLVGAAPDPPGVAEVEDCLGRYVNNTLYNVGPHLVLRNSTLTHTELSVFCRTNVTDLYRCIKPHLKTEVDLTSAILRTLEHICHEDQQPEWLKHSACVPYGRDTCLAGLEDNEALVTLYGVSVNPDKTLVDQCRLLKDYVRCVYGAIAEACDKDAADWHIGLIRKQWGPYEKINVCDIFDDKVVIPPPPDVAAVLTCHQNYTKSALYTVGAHLVLKTQTLTDTQVAEFCTTDVENLYTCIEPYRGTILTKSLTRLFEHLCDGNQQKEWVKYSQCGGVDPCATDLKDSLAWVTMNEFEVVGDQVVNQCRRMKDYVTCVCGDIIEMGCSEAAAEWHRDVIRKIWRPYRDIIACDVYGPTGGTVGVVTGIVVGLLLIGICGLLIWFHPKKSQTKRQLRASTAL